MKVRACVCLCLCSFLAFQEPTHLVHSLPSLMPLSLYAPVTRTEAQTKDAQALASKSGNDVGMRRECMLSRFLRRSRGRQQRDEYNSETRTAFQIIWLLKSFDFGDGQRYRQQLMAKPLFGKQSGRKPANHRSAFESF